MVRLLKHTLWAYITKPKSTYELLSTAQKYGTTDTQESQTYLLFVVYFYLIAPIGNIPGRIRGVDPSAHKQ